MASDDEFNFTPLDWRELSPQQWAELRQNAIRRAELLRRQSNKALVRSVFNGAARAWRALLGAFVWLKAASDDRHAIARLQSLDDRALQDLGIRRAEIESFVHAHGGDETRIQRDKPLAA